MKPPRLRPGDWVGIVSPSSPVTPDLLPQFERGVAALQTMGLRVRVAEHALAVDGYRAGPPDARVDDFRQMIEDPEIRMILMTQGGHSANQLLDAFPFDALRTCPKIVCGISDATTLLIPIYQRTGLVTFYGPDLLWTLGRTLSDPVRKNIEDVLFGRLLSPLQANDHWHNHTHAGRRRDGWRSLRPGHASGPLLGGHVASLVHLAAAGRCPLGADSILFLEGTEPEPGLLDKSLTALRLGGVFDRVAGLVVGWFDRLEAFDTGTETVSDVVLRALDGTTFPILKIDDLGHHVDNYVMPIGCLATLSPADLHFSTESPCTV